jgi:hypothetical protein
VRDPKFKNVFVSFKMFFCAGCLWQGQPAQLIIHYENGFTLMEVLNTLTRREPRTLWKLPFERLRMSADDGARLLWLDFGGEEGEMVSFYCQMFVPRRLKI